jgi:hypothetical protein
MPFLINIQNNVGWVWLVNEIEKMITTTIMFDWEAGDLVYFDNGMKTVARIA